MPSWTRSRSEATDARVLVAGVVRERGESQSLRVEIEIGRSEISMRSDGLVLGTWSPQDVTINRIDPFSFAFRAEGDRLVFVPDDAKAFAALPIAKSAAGTAKQTKRKLSVRLPTLPRVRRPRTDGTATTPPPAPVPVKKTTRTRPRSMRVPRLTRTGTAIAATPAPGSGARTVRGGAADRSKLWMKAVDTARENGWFGLDRVPVRIEDRGSPHQHTYEHGAAASSGVGAHVCALCGKVRIRT